jgi:hypothetical protein
MAPRRHIAGSAQLIVLVVIAAALGVGYVFLDRSNAESKELLLVETRGVRMMSALTKYRLENGNYPGRLEDLVPNQVAAVSTCPDGGSMGYRAAEGEYVLTCFNVGVRKRPYSYDSRTRAWGG